MPLREATTNAAGRGHDMRSKTGALLLVALSLSGCATAAQRQAATIATQLSEAGEANKICVADVGANPQFAGIGRHLPLDGSPANLEQKADPSLATPQETKLILSWRSEFANCRLALNTAVRSFAPALMPALLETQNASDAIWVKSSSIVRWAGAARSNSSPICALRSRKRAMRSARK